jgi:hypothetical protein
MPARIRFLLLLFLAALAALPARALLGETLGDLKKRFGPPEVQMEKRKDNAYWLFEGDDGQLMYSVTFNAQGRSMAEGLKPLKLARFNKARVMEFIESELVLVRDSPTLRRPKPGESYTFAGKALTCAETEYIAVDDKQGILVVWNKSGVPAVLVISPEMMNATGG